MEVYGRSGEGFGKNAEDGRLRCWSNLALPRCLPRVVLAKQIVNKVSIGVICQLVRWESGLSNERERYASIVSERNELRPM